MTNGLRVSNIAPVGERPADVIRGRTGIAVAGVGTIFGIAISDAPTTDGDILVYDLATDSYFWATVDELLGNEFVTRTEGGQERAVINAAAGAAATIDCSLGNVFDLTLTANCTLTITNAPPATDADGNHQTGRIAVILRQGGSGSYTVTYPAAVKWQSATGTNTGSAPTLWTTVGAEDVVELSTIDGGVTWGGEVVSRSPSAGTVTSVALTVPAEFSVAGSPITTAGTLAVTAVNESANTVWAGPTAGSAAAPAFRALVAADIPAGTGTTDHVHINAVTFNGDGATTIFYLPAAPFDAYSIHVAVGTAFNNDWTLSGAMLDVLTFGVSPTAGTNNISVDIIAAV